MAIGLLYFKTMKRDAHHRLISRTIKDLASRACLSLPKDSASFREAALRRVKPMDYLRCAEFPLALDQLSLKPGMRLLDVASPQWFSLALASRNPAMEFVYINILEEELDQIRGTAKQLGLSNIQYRLMDCRKLDYPARSFDRVVSLSTLEHISPAVGGDVLALHEIHRVLKEGGEFVLSVPFKEKAGLVYDDIHAVWEKPAQKDNFYMRNYSRDQLEKLALDTHFSILRSTPMYERPGLFAMEYWEGAGRTHPKKDGIMRLKKKLDKLTGRRLENFLSLYYIKLGEEVAAKDRLMNVVALFAKK